MNSKPAFSFSLWGFPVHVESANLFLCVLIGLMAGSTSKFGPIYGVFVAIVLFTSVFIHECGHAWMAKRLGAKVIEMRMTGMGGYVRHGGGLSHPRAFLITLAGPLANLIIAVLAWNLLAPLGGVSPYLALLASVYINWNIMLMVFNLFPVIPLDGGHLLHRLLMMFYSTSRDGRVVATRNWFKTPDEIVGWIGVAFAVAWIPMVFVIYKYFGILPLFMLPLQYNWALAKGQAKIPL